jgi:hypothetical protein
VFDAARRERLRALLHQSPRTFGHPSSGWTLPLAAQVAYAQGLTPRQVSGEAIRQALQHLRIGWKRAKHWITSPDPHYARKKQRDRLIRRVAAHPDGVLGVVDEVWWSRLAHPHLHRWAAVGEELRLVEKAAAKDDPDPKALACYGLLMRATPMPPAQLWVRFATGQPVTGLTTEFLAWCSERVEQLGKQALRLSWDNASWHRSQGVQAWLRSHNRTVKQTQRGVRIESCYLPSPSPWLNPIEPQGTHGKRAVLEPQRLLTARELEARVYAYYESQPMPRLSITQKVT